MRKLTPIIAAIGLSILAYGAYIVAAVGVVVFAYGSYIGSIPDQRCLE